MWHRLRHGRDLRVSGDHERGTVSLFMVVVLAVLMVSSAFTVDLGLQRVARSDMQALADVVALDLSRELDGRTVAELTPVLTRKAAESIARNSGMVGDDADLDFQMGSLDADGDFGPMASGVPTAVSVTAATEVAFAFAGFTGRDEGAAEREAAAAAVSNACFRLGSFAAALRSGDSVVGDVFEALMQDRDALGVNLRAIGYDGLLDTWIDLEALAVEMGVGSVNELVDLGAVGLQDFLQASARVLDSDGDTDASAVLGTIARRVSADVTARVGDILAVGGGSAVSSRINTIDLVGGAGMAAALSSSVADHNNLLRTGVVWSEAHVSHGDIDLTVLEPPRQACGAPNSGATASTGQLRLSADLGFNLPNKLLGLSVGSVADPSRTQTLINVRAELAGAQARLTGLSCEDGRTEFRMMVDSRLTDIDLNLPFTLKGSLGVSLLEQIVPARLIPSVARRLLDLEVELKLNAGVRLTSGAREGSEETVYAVPPHDYTDPEPSAGASGAVSITVPRVSVDASSKAWITVAGVRLGVALNLDALNLSSILDAVTTSVIGTSLTGVVGNLNDALEPVTRLLGLRVAGADVFGLPGPMCNLPRLVG